MSAESEIAKSSTAGSPDALDLAARDDAMATMMFGLLRSTIRDGMTAENASKLLDAMEKLLARHRELTDDIARLRAEPTEAEIRALKNMEDMLSNVVEDCYQPGKLHCSACERSLTLALEIVRDLVAAGAVRAGEQ